MQCSLYKHGRSVCMCVLCVLRDMYKQTSTTVYIYTDCCDDFSVCVCVCVCVCVKIHPVPSSVFTVGSWDRIHPMVN